MLSINVSTKNFFWANFKEYKIEENGFQIANKNIGLQNSSCFLPEGEYTVIFDNSPRIFTPEDIIYSFEGIPELSGSVRDNKWLEENTRSHTRQYHVPSDNNLLNAFVTRELFNENNVDIDKKIFIYVKKQR